MDYWFSQRELYWLDHILPGQKDRQKDDEAMEDAASYEIANAVSLNAGTPSPYTCVSLSYGFHNCGYIFQYLRNVITKTVIVILVINVCDGRDCVWIIYMRVKLADD